MRCFLQAVSFDRKLVEIYRPLILMARRYYPHDEQRAYDLAADTVERAIRARESFDVSRPLLPWCRAIMRNLYLNTENRLETMNTQPLGDWECEGGNEPDQCVMVHEILALIRALSRRSVSVETLVDFAKGFSLAEIARTRGVPLGTVKRRIHDAREMLAKLVNVN